MKRITVIIPVYNAENNISKCLDSIVIQLSEEDELLLIDDGSTDNSYNILCGYEKNYPFIRVIKQENIGVANTRNRGIYEAKGKYICFIDNDDYVDGDYFEKFYEAIEKNKSDIVIGGYRRVSDKGVKFSIKPVKGEWYKLMVVAPWSKLYRRKFLTDNDIKFLNYGIGEDIYFNFNAYTKTENINVIPYSGYNWWFNTKSISNTSQRGFNKNIDVCYLLNQLLDITGKDGIYNYYYLRYAVWYLLFSGKNAKRDEFMMEYKKIFKWLKKNNISHNFLKYQFSIGGEGLLNRIAVGTIIILDKLKIMDLFTRFYCGK